MNFLHGLPTAWVSISLNDLCIDIKQRAPLPDEQFTYIDIASIDRDLKQITEPQMLIGQDAPSRARKVIMANDVLVSMTRPNLNAVALVQNKLLNPIASTGFDVLRANLIEPKWLYFHVRSQKFIDTLLDKVQGALYPAVKSSDIRSYEIPLPPLAEQQEIATRLDDLLAQVDVIKARLDAIPAILKRFRQAVLAAAVSGKLTEDWKPSNLLESAKELRVRWRQERLAKSSKSRPVPEPDIDRIVISIPNHWELLSVGEFAECLDNKRIPVKKEHRLNTQGLYPYFGANGEVDRVDDFIFDEDIVLVTEDETFYGREKPISYRYTGKCWVNNHAHVLKAPTKVANDFLCYVLMYYPVLPWLTGTTGRAKLTQAALNSLPVGLPPETEQTEIVNRVEQLFAFADQIEQQVQAAQTRVNQLTQAILAKAFKGELTAAWRAAHPELISGENSAEALLEKIKVSQIPAKPKRGKTTNNTLSLLPD